MTDDSLGNYIPLGTEPENSQRKSGENSNVESLPRVKFSVDVSAENIKAVKRVIYFVCHELKNSPEDQRKVVKMLFNRFSAVAQERAFLEQLLP